MAVFFFGVFDVAFFLLNYFFSLNKRHDKRTNVYVYVLFLLFCFNCINFRLQSLIFKYDTHRKNSRYINELQRKACAKIVARRKICVRYEKRKSAFVPFLWILSSQFNRNCQIFARKKINVNVQKRFKTFICDFLRTFATSLFFCPCMFVACFTIKHLQRCQCSHQRN